MKNSGNSVKNVLDTHPHLMTRFLFFSGTEDSSSEFVKLPNISWYENMSFNDIIPVVLKNK